MKMMKRTWFWNFSAVVTEFRKGYKFHASVEKQIFFMYFVKLFMRDRVSHILCQKSHTFSRNIWYTLRGHILAGWITAWGNVLLSEPCGCRRYFSKKSMSVIFLHWSLLICPPRTTSQAHFAFCLHYLLKQQMYLYGTSTSVVLVGHTTLLLLLFCAS